MVLTQTYLTSELSNSKPLLGDLINHRSEESDATFPHRGIKYSNLHHHLTQRYVLLRLTSKELLVQKRKALQR